LRLDPGNEKVRNSEEREKNSNDIQRREILCVPSSLIFTSEVVSGCEGKKYTNRTRKPSAHKSKLSPIVGHAR